MPDPAMSRRRLVMTALAALGVYGGGRDDEARAAPTELPLPDDVPRRRFDFDSHGIDGWTTVDVSVAFKPISGHDDASGGIVFQFTDARYYVVRANALEGNFRLYYYDRRRRQLATASVTAPALGQWHTLRVVAFGDHLQGWLNGTRLLDHRDTRFTAGRVGLWTKADSVTAFDDLTIRGSPRALGPSATTA